jgi:hypothetical protein
MMVHPIKSLKNLSILLIFYAPIVCSLNDPSQELIARTLSPTPIVTDLQELTSTIGGRPTGSAAMNKAVAWAIKRFNDAGLENVHTEEYTPSRNWLPGVESGEFYVKNSKIGTPLRVATMPFSLSTPVNGLMADVYDIGSGSKNEFIAAGTKPKGKWLLVRTPLMSSIHDLLEEYAITPNIFARAKKSGAIGVLWLSNRPGRLLYRHNITFNGKMAMLPAATIERKGGEQILATLKQGQAVKVKLVLQNVVQEKPTNYNVIAEIKGSEKPEEVILLGAHLDSWDLGKGALDNGCNVALVIDVARQIMTLVKHGQRPKRTLRFMLYSGEELGLYGSWFDTINHRKDLDNIKAVIIFDLGTGQTTGFSLSGRKDMTELVNNALKPISALGPFIQTYDAGIDTDNFDYVLQGIPTLVANQDPKPYLAPYHAESDTFDKANLRELKLNTAIASVLMWNLANQQTFPIRQSREEIINLLKTTGLIKEMINFDIWDDFEKGYRGRL